MVTNENVCNIEPNPQTYSQRYLHVFQDGGREEKVNLDFFLNDFRRSMVTKLLYVPQEIMRDGC